MATKSHSFTVLDDSATEVEESFRIVVSGTGLPDAVVVTQADGTTCSLCYSEVVIVDDESPPAQVTGVRLTPGQGELTVYWTAVPGATGYKVQWKSGMETFADAATDSREAIVSSGSTASHSISGLNDGTLYTVRVIATRTGAPSDGAASSEVNGTPGTPGPPTLTIADARATEGNAVSFTVTLNPVAASDVTVEYAAADGTATADSSHEDGADYTAPAGGAILTIAAGETSGTISIATGNDTVDEDDETFTVTLSNQSSNASLGADKTAAGTIEDDDTDAAQVTNVAFTNVPSDGVYGLGDVIEVSVTFDAAVDVTGSPRVALQLPGAPAADRYALYDASASSDTELVFRKTVTAAVDDMDGTGVAANALELNGGGIVNKDTTVAAVLDHDALSGGNIRTRIISGIEITSDPSVATPAGYYGAGETVEFTVSFSQAVTVSGTLQLKFIASDQGRQTAAYASGTGSAELVFTWTVPTGRAGRRDPDRNSHQHRYRRRAADRWRVGAERRHHPGLERQGREHPPRAIHDGLGGGHDGAGAGGRRRRRDGGRDATGAELRKGRGRRGAPRRKLGAGGERFRGAGAVGGADRIRRRGERRDGDAHALRTDGACADGHCSLHAGRQPDQGLVG